ncbi:MAG: flagellar hook-associated protein FlgK [Lachnospiraceae bacterium]|nr:flagellar hook-associated protein FlgK [Lachnospiraceae bacterium]
MASQFFGLMIGYSGIIASEVQENTVAHNSANANTEGYSRQVVNTTASDALRVYQRYGMTGTGISVTSVTQLRNLFYDTKYWNNNADCGMYSTLSSYMTQIEKYFKDNSSSEGFSTISDKLYAALESLSTNPSSTTARESVVGTSQSLTEYFNLMADNLKQLQVDANSEIKTTVTRINSIAQEVAALNQQINVLEIQGVAANDLRDSRALLIDELSEYVDVTVTETPVIDESTGTESGANVYRVNICNGNSLVDGYRYHEIECVSRENKTNMCDADGLYDLRWKETGNTFSVLANNLTGSLKALFQLRDGNNEENLKGTLTAVGDNTFTMLVDTYNEETSLDEIISKLNIAASGNVKVDGRSFTYTGWSLTYNETDNTATFVFTGVEPGTNNDVEIADISTGTSATFGESIDYKGIAYYQAQMNQWVRDYARVFNTIEKTGEDMNGDSLSDENRNYFVWENEITGIETGFTEADSDATITIADITDSTTGQAYQAAVNGTDTTAFSYYNITAGNFNVNGDIVDDTTLMSTTATDGDVNLTANDIVKELIDIKTNKTKMKFRGGTSSEFLTVVLSDMALASANAETFSSNAKNIKNSIENQRLSVAGVDIEEETLDLLKYQKCYSLNSKVISVMAQIYDRLILETGV